MKILCFGTVSALQMQELYQGEWSESVISSEITDLQSYQGPQTRRRETRPRFLSVLESWQRKTQRKIFLSPPFSSLGWMSVSAAPFKSDYLTFRNEFAKETAAYHKAANGMPPRPPAPRTWDEQLEMCRAKGMFALHHRRQVLISFHYASSLLLSFSHCLPQGELHNLKIMGESHFYYSTKKLWGFSINTSAQTF